MNLIPFHSIERITLPELRVYLDALNREAANLRLASTTTSTLIGFIAGIGIDTEPLHDVLEELIIRTSANQQSIQATMEEMQRRGKA